MKLENQVTSLEISRQMKEAGFPQDSYWYWAEDEGIICRHEQIKNSEDYINGYFISAYTVAELGEILPCRYINDDTIYSDEDDEIRICKDEDGFYLVMRNAYGDEIIDATIEYLTEADARGKMALYLKKEGLI